MAGVNNKNTKNIIFYNPGGCFTKQTAEAAKRPRIKCPEFVSACEFLGLGRLISESMAVFLQTENDKWPTFERNLYEKENWRKRKKKKENQSKLKSQKKWKYDNYPES